MPMVKKSITVTDKQEAWIREQIASGVYSNDSEVIRDALRDKANRMAEIEYVREKLIRAEQGGWVDEPPDKLLASFKEEARRDGKL